MHEYEILWGQSAASIDDETRRECWWQQIIHASNIHHQHFHQQIMIKLSLSLVSSSSPPQHLGQCNHQTSSNLAIKNFFNLGKILVWRERDRERERILLFFRAFLLKTMMWIIFVSPVPVVLKTNSWLWRWQLVIIPSDKALQGNWVAGLQFEIKQIFINNI